MEYGSGMPGDDHFEDHERISDEYSLEQIEKNLGLESQIPDEHYLEMRRFLAEFNIKNADQVTREEVELLWQQLGQSPSLIKDLAYISTDIKTTLNLSEYPLAVSMDDLLLYAQKLDNPWSLRSWIIEKEAIPNLTSIGFNRSQVVENAFGDSEGRIRAADATRFMGWVSGLPIMANLKIKMEEFKEQNEIEKLTLTHIAQVAMIEVIDNQERLKSMTPRYRENYPMEVEAREVHQDAIAAMQGIYNIFDRLLLGVPKQQ